MPIPEDRKLYKKAKPKADPLAKPSKPAKQHQFSYMLDEATVAELSARGVEFCTAEVSPGEFWPALLLPSKTILTIARDDEGNGPGAIHVAKV